MFPRPAKKNHVFFVLFFLLWILIRKLQTISSYQPTCWSCNWSKYDSWDTERLWPLFLLSLLRSSIGLSVSSGLLKPPGGGSVKSRVAEFRLELRLSTLFAGLSLLRLWAISDSVTAFSLTQERFGLTFWRLKVPKSLESNVYLLLWAPNHSALTPFFVVSPF